MFKKKNLTKHWLLIAITLFSAISVTVFFNLDKISRLVATKEEFKSGFTLNEMGYSCSKPIHGKSVPHRIGPNGSSGFYFYPTNQEEFEKYCRSTFIIEYHAVIDVLQKQDVHTVIDKYDTTQAWVRALAASYIQDKDYLSRILPDYTQVNIHCIIVVHSPEGTRFFLEDGDQHHAYIEVPADEFLSSLNQAPDDDANNFWLGLH